MDTLSICSVAEQTLQNLGRTSFSGDGFTNAQIDAISKAITNAIEEYDKQIHSSEN